MLVTKLNNIPLYYLCDVTVTKENLIKKTNQLLKSNRLLTHFLFTLLVFSSSWLLDGGDRFSEISCQKVTQAKQQ